MISKRTRLFSVLIAGAFLFFANMNPSCFASDQCTVAIIAGSATADGRPLLMKSRDVTNDEQEFHYNDDGPYVFVSVSYAGVTDQTWGGVNEVGFAIQNANAWNFNDNIPGPDDDGYIILEALSTCQTVDDFVPIMDSTNITGRTRPAIYGVIDAFGDGVIFEAAASWYDRYDLDDTLAAPNGYMVRANFAYSGSSYHLGQHRHDRALAFMDTAYAGGYLTRQYLFQTILRDLVNEETDPYPLPFQGKEPDLPYGLIHTHDAINRDITRSAYVVEGILPGENPLLSTVWAMAGEPIFSIALPLWVHAGSTPIEFDGPNFSTLNIKARAFRDYAYQHDWDSDALDTWHLIDDRGFGLLPFLLSLEDQAAAVGDSTLNVWRNQGLPAPTIVEDFQDNLASWALTEMETWGPPQSPEIDITQQSPDQVLLDWSPVTLDVFERPITVSAYTIYASDQPFYNRLAGDSITTVVLPPVIIQAPEDYRFFQVRCQP